MKVSESHCKSILTRTSGYLGDVSSHSLNPYSGCGFGKSSCGICCYVQFNTWITKGRSWGEFVDVKTNSPEVYKQTYSTEKRWAGKRFKPFSIFMSSSTDPWQPIEKKYRITRNILQAMLSAPPDELILQTHSVLIEEDLDLISQLAKLCCLRVHISIEGESDNLPGLPSPPSSNKARIELLEKFSIAGIKSVACLSPLYPISDPHLFFSKLANTGAHAAVIDHFIQGDGTKDGSRTYKTVLPSAMAKLNPESIQLSYRDAIANIARAYLPVGISASGFAGNYFSNQSD
ncbi:MAG: SPL family radical SAM protein [Nitrospinales bacterium]